MYIEQENKSKGLTARILGEQPTTLQKIFVWFMLITLLSAVILDGELSVFAGKIVT